jgi:phosphate starvation-inducible PhoH-like protein
MAKRKTELVEKLMTTGPLLTKKDFVHVKFTNSQLKFFKTMADNIITTCTGPAGTAKTFVACYSALDHYSRGACKKIVLVKPAVESGDPLGFLPGTLHEKIAPFMESYLSNMEKIIGKELVTLLISKGVIEMKSLSHIRGATEDEAYMIMDESQNSDLRQIILFVTRMGKDSKIVICGDTTQFDQFKRRKDFSIFSRIMEGVKNIAKFEFTREDIVRHPLLVEITDKYEQYKADNGIE